MKWYGAIGLFRHVSSNPDRITMYEERVVIVSAKGEAEAIAKILNDFKQYGSGEDGCEFLDQYEIRETYDPPGSEVTDVACNTRITNIAPEEYIKKYWGDLRPASCGDAGWRHVWYNAGHGKSSCYNCQETRDGQLWKK